MKNIPWNLAVFRGDVQYQKFRVSLVLEIMRRWSPQHPQFGASHWWTGEH